MPASLRDEIKQTRPFRSPQAESVLAILYTADRVRRALVGVIEAHGITLQQYNVLRILRGSHPEPLPTLEIAERMIEQTPGITRLLDRIEQKGWVRRERCATDRRQVLCHSTPEGLRLLETLDSVVADAEEAVGCGLTRGDHKALIDLLARLRAGLR